MFGNDPLICSQTSEPIELSCPTALLNADSMFPGKDFAQPAIFDLIESIFEVTVVSMFWNPFDTEFFAFEIPFEKNDLMLFHPPLTVALALLNPPVNKPLIVVQAPETLDLIDEILFEKYVRIELHPAETVDRSPVNRAAPAFSMRPTKTKFT